MWLLVGEWVFEAVDAVACLGARCHDLLSHHLQCAGKQEKHTTQRDKTWDPCDASLPIYLCVAVCADCAYVVDGL